MASYSRLLLRRQIQQNGSSQEELWPGAFRPSGEQLLLSKLKISSSCLGPSSYSRLMHSVSRGRCTSRTARDAQRRSFSSLALVHWATCQRLRPPSPRCGAVQTQSGTTNQARVWSRSVSRGWMRVQDVSSASFQPADPLAASRTWCFPFCCILGDSVHDNTSRDRTPHASARRRGQPRTSVCAALIFVS